MEGNAVNRAVEAILADYDREGQVTKDGVYRVLQRRKLDAAQSVEALRMLAEHGLDLLPASESTPGRARDEAPPLVRAPPIDTRRVRGRYATRDRGVSRDAVGSLMERMGRYRLLNAEEEVTLGRRVRAGQQAAEAVDAGDLTSAEAQPVLADAAAAKEQFALANLRLVVSEAKSSQYEGLGLEFEDRVQEAYFGLLRAIEKFDPDLGYKFSTYAMWWLRQSLQRAVADKGRTVRLPVHVHEQAQRIRVACRKLELRLGRPARLVELADDVELEPARVAFLLDVTQQPASLDTVIGDDSDTPFVELLAASPIDDAENTFVREACAAELEDILQQCLDDRGREILRRRFGYGTVGSDGCDSLEEIGQDFGVTRERIRQIQKEALTVVRQVPETQSLRVYLETA